jgi:sodium-independent sulfate anion transporter 11
MNSITQHVYYDPIPSVKNWITNTIKNPKQQIKNYFLSFFPFLNWIYRYNLVWFWSDLIAGLTVGAVVIPQGMAYAGLAKLAPQFGLYSSFVGVMIYWFFATSKVNNSKQLKNQYLNLQFSIGYYYWTCSCNVNINGKYNR